MENFSRYKIFDNMSEQILEDGYLVIIDKNETKHFLCC